MQSVREKQGPLLIQYLARHRQEISRMTNNNHDLPVDPIWGVAWCWVQRQHDAEHFDDAARTELLAWLSANPEHKKAYDKAARIWLLCGLVPPSID